MILILLLQLLLSNPERRSLVSIDNEYIHYNKTDIQQFKINKSTEIKLNLIDKLDSNLFDHASISERINNKNILISKADFSYVIIDDSLKKTYGYLPKGKGPGEIMQILQTSSYENTIVIVDNTIGKIVHFVENFGELKFVKEEINEDILKNMIINYYIDENNKNSIMEKAIFDQQIFYKRYIQQGNSKYNYDLFFEKVDSKKYLPKVAYTLAFHGKIRCYNDKYYKIYDRINVIENISVNEENNNIIYIDENETRKLEFEKATLKNKDIITLDFIINNSKIYTLVKYSDKSYGMMQYDLNKSGEIDINKVFKYKFVENYKSYRFLIVNKRVMIVDLYNNIYEYK